MYQEHLPRETVRALGMVIVFIADMAVGATRRAVERLRPIVQPPDDLRLVSPVGAVYTGLLIVESGVVIAGIVVEVARTYVERPPEPLQHRAPIVTPPPRYGDQRSGHLPGWAEDPRDLLEDEDERWRRR